LAHESSLGNTRANLHSPQARCCSKTSGAEIRKVVFSGYALLYRDHGAEKYKVVFSAGIALFNDIGTQMSKSVFSGTAVLFEGTSAPVRDLVHPIRCCFNRRIAGRAGQKHEYCLFRFSERADGAWTSRRIAIRGLRAANCGSEYRVQKSSSITHGPKYNIFYFIYKMN
jgi:hypothetical protein